MPAPAPAPAPALALHPPATLPWPLALPRPHLAPPLLLLPLQLSLWQPQLQPPSLPAAQRPLTLPVSPLPTPAPSPSRCLQWQTWPAAALAALPPWLPRQRRPARRMGASRRACAQQRALPLPQRLPPPLLLPRLLLPPLPSSPPWLQLPQQVGAQPAQLQRPWQRQPGAGRSWWTRAGAQTLAHAERALPQQSGGLPRQRQPLLRPQTLPLLQLRVSALFRPYSSAPQTPGVSPAPSRCWRWWCTRQTLSARQPWAPCSMWGTL